MYWIFKEKLHNNHFWELKSQRENRKENVLPYGFAKLIKEKIDN